GHRPGAKVVAIGETARNDDEICIRKFGFGVPYHTGIAARGSRERHAHVTLAIGPGENDDSGLHAPILGPATRSPAARPLLFSTLEFDRIVLDDEVRQELPAHGLHLLARPSRVALAQVDLDVLA